MENKTFAQGINFKRNENAPDFVVGKLTIKADAAIEFIEKYSKDNWMNLDIKKAKSGKYYIELDTYKATPIENRTDLGPGKYVTAEEFDNNLGGELPF